MHNKAVSTINQIRLVLQKNNNLYVKNIQEQR